jgi:hypothetical protein
MHVFVFVCLVSCVVLLVSVCWCLVAGIVLLVSGGHWWTLVAGCLKFVSGVVFRVLWFTFLGASGLVVGRLANMSARVGPCWGSFGYPGGYVFARNVRGGSLCVVGSGSECHALWLSWSVSARFVSVRFGPFGRNARISPCERFGVVSACRPVSTPRGREGRNAPFPRAFQGRSRSDRCTVRPTFSHPVGSFRIPNSAYALVRMTQIWLNDSLETLLRCWS